MSNGANHVIYGSCSERTLSVRLPRPEPWRTAPPGFCPVPLYWMLLRAFFGRSSIKAGPLKQ
jgi:hypothetical protein